MQQFLIEKLSDTELKQVFDELFMDDTVDIIEEMPANVTKRILKQTTAEKRKMINQLLAYPDDSAGSIMNTEYIDLKKTMTVKEAFERIRRRGVDSEMIYTCYVTDARRHLLGIVSVRDLLLNEYDAIIEDIMEENVIFANTLDNKESVAAMFEKYDFMALPIVDTEKRLIGIVTVDELKGKRVSIGEAGSGVTINAKQVFEAAGMKLDLTDATNAKKNDVVVSYYSVKDSCDRIKDGEIDAFFFTAGVPTSGITELIKTTAAIVGKGLY